ncbi:uncharacterized protein SOCE836_061380 [Sorangium cellulosum]|uniref:Uncharacterized protein n=1 Tax=Sorangium cellulosum TaxID=56 RepID=A0A4P2QUE2_SORCE|nr:uncharacterized protein SOCE836_061380 [Sorangium cellulosum]WCQ93280.1 hypothetical protein NQZ70_06028 [Sorangium sp. Soce836]
MAIDARQAISSEQVELGRASRLGHTGPAALVPLEDLCARVTGLRLGSSPDVERDCFRALASCAYPQGPGSNTPFVTAGSTRIVLHIAPRR